MPKAWILAVLFLLVPTVVGATPVLLENVAPEITTFGSNPNAAMYTSNPAGFYNGVARLSIATNAGSSFICSGALIGVSAVLTAAHCVDPASLGASLINSIGVTFENGVTASGLTWSYSPTWNPGAAALFDGDDIGVIKLTTIVSGITPYSLYTGLGFGSTADLAGYGRRGTGATGSVAGSAGTFRHGQNQLDATVSPSGFIVPGTSSSGLFLYDFDNGTSACNAILGAGVPSSLGLGANEVLIAPGDSGGPSFIGGMLAGVHSFGANNSFDCAGGGLNSSFGEFGGDTRVAANLAFVYAAVPEASSVPEPSSILLLGAGLAGLASHIRRRP